MFQSDEISHVITELERSISRYKEEYAALISQAQAIKTDLATVEAKVYFSNTPVSSCLDTAKDAVAQA